MARAGIESSNDIHYFKMGLFDSEHIPHYNSIFEAPNLGLSLFGDWNKIDRYLVMPKKLSVNSREVPQMLGGTKFAVDQLINSKSFELKLGDIYSKEDNIIVAGRIATISEDEFSNVLYKSFLKKIKKEFRKIGAFYVGKGAEEKLRLGWRLVTNHKSPEQYDLILN